MTTEQCYNDFLTRLTAIYENREAINIADWVFESTTGLKKFERNINRNVELEKDTVQKLKVYLGELLKYKPVQYVLKEAWFYKMKFYVNEHVLVPRPETEELIEWTVKDIRSLKSGAGNRDLKILDVGTGSGCIAISLKKELQNAEATAVDISNEALSVAKTNADELRAKINFIQTDFLDEKFWKNLDVYDIIISNPPYIPAKEKQTLNKNVTEFEPSIALFVPDNNPFIFYEKITKFAQFHLKKNGNVYVEIHENYFNEVERIFSKNNFQTEIRKDMYGKERMIKASLIQNVS